MTKVYGYGNDIDLEPGTIQYNQVKDSIFRVIIDGTIYKCKLVDSKNDHSVLMLQPINNELSLPHQIYFSKTNSRPDCYDRIQITQNGNSDTSEVSIFIEDYPQKALQLNAEYLPAKYISAVETSTGYNYMLADALNLICEKAGIDLRFSSSDTLPELVPKEEELVE